MSFSQPVWVSQLTHVYAYCTSLNISVCVTVCSKLLLMKVWSEDQQHCYHLRSGRKCRYSGPTSDILNQNLHF